MSVLNFLKAFPSFQVLKIKEISYFTTKQTFPAVITTVYFFYNRVNELYNFVIATIFMKLVPGHPPFQETQERPAPPVGRLTRRPRIRRGRPACCGRRTPERRRWSGGGRRGRLGGGSGAILLKNKITKYIWAFPSSMLQLSTFGLESLTQHPSTSFSLPSVSQGCGCGGLKRYFFFSKIRRWFEARFPHNHSLVLVRRGLVYEPEQGVLLRLDVAHLGVLVQADEVAVSRVPDDQDLLQVALLEKKKNTRILCFRDLLAVPVSLLSLHCFWKPNDIVDGFSSVFPVFLIINAP